MVQMLRGGGITHDLDADKTYAPFKAIYACDELLKPGMFAIDGGAYTGDTAEIFSDYVGTGGKVFAFEPTEKNFKVLKERKLQNCECVQKGLYSRECNLEFAQFDVVGGGANTFVQNAVKWAEQVVVVPVISIDKFVEDNQIPRVDFIKMDIEGSELEALKGAEDTIRRHRPNMAISIYHNNGNDVIDIPVWLVSNFGDSYHFRIAHHTKGWWETVIYAKSREF
jgi:FkbM family methyltransferase